MLVASRAELVTQLCTTTDTADLFAIGMSLIAIAFSKDGDTLQDSIDLYRRYVRHSPELEDTFRRAWDQMRDWK